MNFSVPRPLPVPDIYLHLSRIAVFPSASSAASPASRCNASRPMSPVNRPAFAYMAGALGPAEYPVSGPQFPARSRRTFAAPLSPPAGLAVPLLHLANFIGGDWPQKAQAAIAALLPVTRSQDQSLSLRLLSDVRDAFLSRSNPEYVSSADLLEFLNRLDHGMWNAYRKGAPVNADLLSQILRPFEVFSRTRRQDRATVIRVYLRDDFADAWSRYLPPLDLSHELDAEDAESFAVEEPDAQESGCSNSPIATATSIATGNRQC